MSIVEATRINKTFQQGDIAVQAYNLIPVLSALENVEYIDMHLFHLAQTVSAGKTDPDHGQHG